MTPETLTCPKHLEHNQLCDGCQQAARQRGFWFPGDVSYRLDKDFDEVIPEAVSAILARAESEAAATGLPVRIHRDPKDETALILDVPQTGPDAFRIKQLRVAVSIQYTVEILR